MPTDRDIALVRAGLKAAAAYYRETYGSSGKMLDAIDPAAIAATVSDIGVPTYAMLEVDNIRLREEREDWQERLAKAEAELTTLRRNLEQAQKWSETIFQYIQSWQANHLISGGIAPPPHMQKDKL